MKIVFCEDEPVIRRLIELSLRGTAYQFRTAAGAADALELVRRWRPDVLVTDIAMPGMTGLELAAAVRGDDDLRELPIVFMTASINRGAEEAETGAHRPAAHLRKPFGPSALRAVLASLEPAG